MSDRVDIAPEAIAPGAVPSPAETKGAAAWREIKGIFWVLVAVLAFHSFIAKPFYIPSESMMPGLLKGDRLVVSKYPFGWSWVSPSFHVLPHWSGRLAGHLPQRGDVVIVTPPGGTDDWIKRVIGLPGDTIEMRGGHLILNGTPVKEEPRAPAFIAMDANVTCGDEPYPRQAPMMSQYIRTESGGQKVCALPIVHETLPSGVNYDTVNLGTTPGDDMAPVTVGEGQVFLMGDNRDGSADSRIPASEGGLGGPVPWENLGGRAEFITFSLDGTASWYNPISWLRALRSGRSGTSLHPAKG